MKVTGTIPGIELSESEVKKIVKEFFDELTKNRCITYGNLCKITEYNTYNTSHFWTENLVLRPATELEKAVFLLKENWQKVFDLTLN